MDTDSGFQWWDTPDNGFPNCHTPILSRKSDFSLLLQGEVPLLYTFGDSRYSQKLGQCAKYTVTKSCTDTSVGYKVIPKKRQLTPSELTVGTIVFKSSVPKPSARRRIFVSAGLNSGEC